jgi:hypothetical protein
MMTFAESAQYFTFYMMMIVTTFVLIWGLKLVTKALAADANSGKPLVASILSEPGPSPTPQEPGDKGSFSRTAGAIGATGMAAMFIGIGYWVLYGLFFAKGDLAVLKHVGWYFLAGSSMFFPYAFNQLSSVFK